MAFNTQGMRYILVILFTLVFLMSSIAASFASTSSYVLPYPGAMPGSKLYSMGLLFDKLKGLYSFGNFAQFKYNLSESDKYLVEAKTLFEYNQFPLAMRALERSDVYFKKVLPNLNRAKSKKNISEKLELFDQARGKHIEVLEKIKQEVPQVFTWIDEKKPQVVLDIWNKIDQSIAIRTKTYR